MPRISVITPTHSIEWIRQAWSSLLRQTVQDWEWIVVANGAAGAGECRQAIGNDPRVTIVQAEGIFEGTVGALKRRACDRAKADVVFEFDHDDELDRDCLAVVCEEFAREPAAFLCSHAAQLNPDAKPFMMAKSQGWEYRRWTFRGETDETVLAPETPPFLPQNIARIAYAPNHLRAWRRHTYETAGGYNPSLAICDDQDLMCRLYLASGGAFRQLDHCLYKQRIHPANTQQNPNYRRELGRTTTRLYDHYLEPMACMHWSRRHRCIDLGSDHPAHEAWQRHAALEALDGPWPFGTNEVGAFRALNVFQKLRDPVHVLNEAHRCLAHGGVCLIEVPSTDGRAAFSPSPARSFWNYNTFLHALPAPTRPRPLLPIPGLKAAFQLIRLVDFYPSDWHREHKCCCTRAWLAAIKDGPRLHGTYGPPLPGSSEGAPVEGG